jgi:DNA-binding response OmpR family regulator
MVYIVDDDRSVRTSLMRLMRSAGYEARAFADAEEYLEDADDAGTAAGCVILDLNLPGMSGLDLQQLINGREPPAPVVVLTGSHDTELCAKALAAGAASVLRKPCDSTVLLRAVAEALERSTLPSSPLAPPPTHTTTRSGEICSGGTGLDAPDNFVLEEGRALYHPEGSVSFERAVSLVGAAIAAAHRNRVRALLVNTTALTGFPSPDTFERFLAVVEWAKEAKGGVRLAMVARAELIDPQKLGVLVAANRGLLSNIFTSESDARAWLADRDGQ